MTEPQQLLAVEDVAIRAGRGKTTIHRWIEAGLLPVDFVVERGNRPLFYPSTIDRVLPELVAIQEERGFGGHGRRNPK